MGIDDLSQGQYPAVTIVHLVVAFLKVAFGSLGGGMRG